MNEKHRARLDKKIEILGLEMLEPHEQLEYILYTVIPRADTNKLAHRLLSQFGTIQGVLNADPKTLESITGVGSRTAKFLSSLLTLLGVVERSIKTNPAPKFDTLENTVKYVKSYFHGKLNEAAYLFSLTASNRLCAINKISDGIGGETFVFPQKVARQAIHDYANGVVLAHNHPGGSVNPSTSDIMLSRKLEDAFKAVDIRFIDSIIISGDNYFSLSQKGYLTAKWG
jgi:DNA repair protein RadC